MAARKSGANSATTTPRRSTRTRKVHEDSIVPIKQETSSPPKSRKRAAASSEGNAKRVKTEKQEDESEDARPLTGLPSPSATDAGSDASASASDSDFGKPKARTRKPRSKGKPSTKAADSSPSKTSSPSDKSAALKARKLKSYAAFSADSPFPDFAHPTPEECRLAHKILSSIHGKRERPAELKAPISRAGCGDSPSVLDALVRTILSQNTSDSNSTRAKRSMDDVYGRSDEWAAIIAGGQSKLQKAIECGGLSVVKSRVIISILNQTKEKYGKYSLDHLFNVSNDEAMTELISFQGVGPKTASCVLLFCLRRESFAVDTHVHRITGLLGWRPKNADRDQTYQHLEMRIPDEEKYGLHVLLVTHGKRCEECKAGGKSVGKCELRRAFRKGKMEGEAGEEVKEEEIEEVKKELGTDDAQEAYLHGMQQAKR